MLGANPLASNGSLLTAPDLPGRLRGIRARGGKVVVVDPRRSRTAEEADEHHFIRPGTDAHLLLGMVHVLFDEGLVDLGDVAAHVDGLDEVAGARARVHARGGVARRAASTRRRSAASPASWPRADSAAVYGRIGTCTQEFGTLASWLVDVLNVLTGNLDRPGGAMFTMAAAGSANTRGTPGKGKGMRVGRWRTPRARPARGARRAARRRAWPRRSRRPARARSARSSRSPATRSCPLRTPAACAARSRARVHGERRHLPERDTRHADVILPAPSPLYRGALRPGALPARGPQRRELLARRSLELDDAQMPEWQTLLRLAGIAAGQGPTPTSTAFDDFMIGSAGRRAICRTGLAVAGRDAEELIAALAPRRGPERMLDLMLRTGPYGDGFGADPDGLTLAHARGEAARHRLRAARAAHARGAAHAERQDRAGARADRRRRRPAASAARAPPQRRHGARSAAATCAPTTRGCTTSNLVKGKERCTLHVHPDDAERPRRSTDGGRACVTSARGEVEVPVEVTDAIMPGRRQHPARLGPRRPRARSWASPPRTPASTATCWPTRAVDPLSGNAVLNGIPVELAPVRAAAPAPA